MTQDEAKRRDQADPLGRFRSRFILPDGLTYLDGNSLGPLTVAGRDALLLAQRRWAERLIGGWNEDWITLAQRTAAGVARVLGADEDEVLVASDTSTNLYKLALAASLERPERTEIVTDELQFPSDLYVLQGIARDLGMRLVVVPSPDGVHADEGGIACAVTDRTSFVCLSLVAYKSGYLYDAEALARRARRCGARVLLDLSHAAGVVPLRLSEWGVDLAVGCTYKYLNGGPGAPAYLYVRRDLQQTLRSPVQGWFGHAEPFAMSAEYAPSRGVQRFAAGTPPILSLVPIEAGLAPTLEVGVQALRTKSVGLTSAFIEEAERELVPLGFSLLSPREAKNRGSHVSLGHEDALAISQCLVMEHGVVPDFRPPTTLRFGFAPLYNGYQDLVRAVGETAEVVRSRSYERFRASRPAVP